MQDLVQAIVRIAGMSGDESIRPTWRGRFVDVEARGGFPFCQHSAITQSVIARAQAAALDESDPQGREAGIVAAAPS